MRLKNIRYIISAVSITLLITLTLGIKVPHSISDDYSLLLEDRNGNLLDATISSDQQWRFPPGNHIIDKKYKKCVLLFEDKRFFFHKGVDFISLARAFVSNIKKGKIVSGGSTIDMQVVRLSKNNPERTIFEKAIEIITALFLDFKYTKTDIFNMYASGAPFGGNVVGTESATFRYFNHSSKHLSWAESALLAVLPNSPSAIRPSKNRHLLIEKRNRLINRLFTQHHLTGQEHELALEEDIPEIFFAFPHLAPHLLVFANANNAKNKPFRIKTTIDINLQEQVIRLMQIHKTRLQGNFINNAAVIVLDNTNSEVLAYCANYHDFSNREISSHSDMIQAPRSTGSILKPLLYACMLNEGNILTKSLIPDVPVNIKGYAPKNFNRGYDGAAPADRALARSLNVPAVKMLQQYGIEKFYSKLKEMGMRHLNHGPVHYGLSLILGGCEASLWEICGIYSSLAQILHNYYNSSGKYSNQPFKQPKYIFTEEKTPAEKFRQSPALLGASSVFFTFRAMNEAERPGADVNWDFYTNPRKIAWKTGTSFGFRDGWSIGVSHRYVVGVWTGNAGGEGRPGLTGIKTAAPLMFDVFRIISESPSWFTPPFDDMEKIAVCRKSGFPAGPYCETVDTLWQPMAGLRCDICPWHQMIFLDSTGRFRVHAGCESHDNMKASSWFILPPLIEWFYRQKNNWYIPPPPYRTDCISQHETNTRNIQMIYPQTASKIFLPMDFGSAKQQVVFEAAHRIPNTSVFWYIDEKYICETKHYHHIAVSPSQGKHTLVLTDEMGEILTVPFEIIDDNNN